MDPTHVVDDEVVLCPILGEPIPLDRIIAVRESDCIRKYDKETLLKSCVIGNNVRNPFTGLDLDEVTISLLEDYRAQMRVIVYTTDEDARRLSDDRDDAFLMDFFSTIGDLTLQCARKCSDVLNVLHFSSRLNGVLLLDMDPTETIPKTFVRITTSKTPVTTDTSKFLSFLGGSKHERLLVSLRDDQPMSHFLPFFPQPPDYLPSNIIPDFPNFSVPHFFMQPHHAIQQQHATIEDIGRFLFNTSYSGVSTDNSQSNTYLRPRPTAGSDRYTWVPMRPPYESSLWMWEIDPVRHRHVFPMGYRETSIDEEMCNLIVDYNSGKQVHFSRLGPEAMKRVNSGSALPCHTRLASPIPRERRVVREQLVTRPSEPSKVWFKQPGGKWDIGSPNHVATDSSLITDTKDDDILTDGVRDYNATRVTLLPFFNSLGESARELMTRGRRLPDTN